MVEGHWIPVKDGDPRAVGLFSRHYTYRKGRPRRHDAGIGGPGARMVLLTVRCDALFVWRYRTAHRDGQVGVCCSIFRNESDIRSSDLILEAMELAWCKWPGERLFTYVNAEAITSSNPGYCFLKAGWKRLKQQTNEHRLRILECWPPVVMTEAAGW